MKTNLILGGLGFRLIVAVLPCISAEHMQVTFNFVLLFLSYCKHQTLLSNC